jgi:hypothetical protein
MAPDTRQGNRDCIGSTVMIVASKRPVSEVDIS